MSQTNLKLTKSDVHKFLVFKQSVRSTTKDVHISKGIHRFGDISMNGKYRHTSISFTRSAHAPSTYMTEVKGIVVGRKPMSTITLPTFMKPELPNVHKFLSPFYVLLIIFGYVLVADFGMISTAIGFYKFIANLGVVLTISTAIGLLWYTHKNL